MMIAFINTRPFFMPSENALQGFNEIIIILSAYHLILISDFVPAQYGLFHEWSGNSMIIVIMLTTLGFLINIVYDMAKMIYFKIRKVRQKKKFSKSHSDKVVLSAIHVWAKEFQINELKDTIKKNAPQGSKKILIESNLRKLNQQMEFHKKEFHRHNEDEFMKPQEKQIKREENIFI